MKSKNSYYYLLIGALSFFLCLNSAYIHGDDIWHIAAENYFRIYLPYQIPSWIPNRMFDMWGRGVVSLVVSQGYYFLSGFVQNPLEVSYKLVSALLYALLIVLAQKTVADFTRTQSLAGKVEKILVHLLITTSLLFLLPYKEQVHLICYQFPAVLGFYLMANFQDSKNPRIEPTLTFLLVYILAFSLESISLLLFIYSFAYLILLYFSKRHSTRKQRFRGDYATHLLIFSLIINLTAIVIASKFSDRVRFLTQGARSISRSYEYSFSTIRPEFYLVALSIFCSFVFVAFLFRTRKIFGLTDKRNLLRLVLIYFSALTTIYLMSVKMTANYFTMFDFYPFNYYLRGDMFLIGQLALFATFLTLVVRFYKTIKVVHYSTSIMLFIAISALSVKSLRFYEKEAAMAKAVWKVYDRIRASKGGDIVITDFNANHIDDGARPFPGDDQKDPSDGFNDANQKGFKKFLGTENTVNFIYK